MLTLNRPQQSRGRYVSPQGKISVLFTILFMCVSFVSLAQPVNIVVDPQFTTRNVGQSFTISVNVDFTGTTAPLGIDDVEIHLAFDNTKLQVTAMSEDPVVAAFTAKPIPLEASPFTATNAAGQIDYHATTTGGFPTDDFTVLSITFTVIGGDGTTSPLTLRTDAAPNETRAGRSGASILGSVVSGSVTINDAACTTPEVTIGTLAGSSICNARPFELSLTGSTAGTGPFDITVAGPGGSNVYTGVNVGDIFTSFTPPDEKIWPAALFPLPEQALDAPVTLGVKFQSSVSGFVKGVRFFTPTDVSLVPGDYTGQLYTSGGVLLASGTFTGVAPDTWAELIFDQPVLIDANTTYIASYHTKYSTYVSEVGGFTTAVTNGSLTALDDATSGGNGVYIYGTAPAFPNNSVNATNYWVDVIFSPNEYTFTLTNVTDADGCSDNGTIQNLTVTSIDCSELPVNIVVQPAVTTTAVGQTFVVTVASDLISTDPPPTIDNVEVHLAFDNTKLQVVSIVEEATVAAFDTKPIPLEAAPYTNINATGQIDYAATNTTGIPAADFSILTITFEVIGGDGTTTDLDILLDQSPNETRVAGGGGSVLAAAIDGTVTINAAGCIPPDITLIAPEGLLTCDGQTFDLVLSATPVPVGTAPFDITISGPGGTVTYDDVPVGGIITSYAPPVENIWSSNPVPLPPTETDQAVTLGVKFRSSVPGFIRGVRFYSPDEVSAVPGAYTGQLWSESGTLLASGIFTTVTVGDWQELTFASPVLITANTTYIASYHTTEDKYVATLGGLVNAVTNNSSLTVPASADAGGNGVYAYGLTPTFPTLTVDDNYWVDVMFTPSEYNFNLLNVVDADGCANAGALQTLSIISADCNTLPVTMINFSASPKDQSVQLQWSTAYESNNKGFDVERSTNGSNWTAIGFVNGVGNSTSTSHYNYLDAHLASGRYFYRLKQIDLDGRTEYSTVVSAVIGGSSGFVLEQNYPNPFHNETTIRFSLPQQSKVNLSVFDVNGRLVKVLVNESRDAGTHAVSLNTGALSTGLYYYKLQAGQFSAVRKMTIH